MPSKKPPNPFKIPSAKAADQPATRKMLYLVRGELRGDIKQVRAELSSTWDSLRSEIQSVRSELKVEIQGVRTELKAEIHALRTELKTDIRSLDTKMDRGFVEMRGDLQRMQILIEEQNSNNRIVLEGLQMLWQRQDRTDTRLDKLERVR